MVYLDEGGTDRKEPALCVAGVMIHGDYQWREAEAEIDKLIEKYIPEKDRIDFVFHATDIFHGSGYFDRNNWAKDTRTQILCDLAKIIETLRLPIVIGGYQKQSFGAGIIRDDEHDLKRTVVQTSAAMDCAIWADRWLSKYAKSENAVIIAEDTDRVKPAIKTAIKVLRSPPLMKLWGLEDLTMSEFGLPLKRIVDTIHFAAKADSKPLQLADLCAFSINRFLKKKPMVEDVLRVIFQHWWWSVEFSGVKDLIHPPS